ncbi:hypothetical protein WNZ14_14245 [Hoeflea sp. AS60]|uniref:hypothetical protein n=1 Tax=Hoeflea sp. AS60 TaxID=3135780 RepID=UPI00316D8D83
MADLPPSRFQPSEEAALYDLLIDDPFSDPWEFDDLLEAHELAAAPVFLDHVGSLKEALERAIADINVAVAANPHVFPPPLLRQRRFPRIRQMRDVHQFDVGSHLAFCHALACRDAAVQLLERRGMVRLAANLFSARDRSRVYRTELAAASVFHDLYKSLRPRRRLPDKGTDTRSVEWRLPDGSSSRDDDANDENRVGSRAIAIYWPDDASRIGGAIELAGIIGGRVYRAAKTEFIQRENWGEDLLFAAVQPENSLGLELAIIDWLGKGWPADLVAVRKNALRSHSDAMTAFLAALESSVEP